MKQFFTLLFASLVVSLFHFICMYFMVIFFFSSAASVIPIHSTVLFWLWVVIIYVLDVLFGTVILQLLKITRPLMTSLLAVSLVLLASYAMDRGYIPWFMNIIFTYGILFMICYPVAHTIVMPRKYKPYVPPAEFDTPPTDKTAQPSSTEENDQSQKTA